MRTILACAALIGAMQAACAVAAERAAPPKPAAAAQPGEPLGRLFYTPEQRAALDEMRRRPQARLAEAEKSPLPPAPEYVTLNGIVRRSDGATTVWLNDKQVRGRESEEGLQIAPPQRTSPPASVSVRVPQTGAVVDLRVGQQLEVNSGEVKERYRAPPRVAPPSAEAPAAAPAAQEAGSARDRRTSREREVLRDLLREIESPASERAPAPAPSAPAASASASR